MFRQLKAYLRSVRERDPAAHAAWVILLTYPGVHAIAVHRLSHLLWKWRLHGLARLISQVARWLTGIEIHPGARIGERFFIDHGMGVVIGETAEIGDDCTLYHGVTLGGTTWKKEKRHPTLANNVVVGAGAQVLGPIVVGEGARIGSNSVVVKDVPAGATVVGIPGRVVVKQAAATPERVAMARKIGFDAYGQTPDMPDPVAHAVDLMLDHMHEVDEKLNRICSALKQSGVEIKDIEVRDLDLPHLTDEE